MYRHTLKHVRQLIYLLFLAFALHAPAQVIRSTDIGRIGQAPQPQMEALARTLDLGNKRQDSERPQPTESGQTPGLQGFYQCFERGCVYYSAKTGVHAVSGAIFTKYVAEGYERASLGFPVSEEQTCSLPDNFQYQVFEGGRILLDVTTDKLVVYSNPTTIGDAGNCRNGSAGVRILTSPTWATSSARFRVTLNGFKVNGASSDHILEVDGKGDEVYIEAEVIEIDERGRVETRRKLKTDIMGDTNGWNGRVQAGSRSDRGGLQTGDSFPTAEPWRHAGSFYENKPPMLLFEGELASTTKALVIVPTLWEWDGQLRFKSEWDRVFDSHLDNLRQSMSRHLIDRQPKFLFDSHDAETQPLGLKTYVNGGYFDDTAFDEPAGSDKQGDYLKGKMGNGYGLEFKPSILLFTFESAQSAASYRSDKGPGIIEVRYRGYPADYSLYVQVERVP